MLQPKYKYFDPVFWIKVQITYEEYKPNIIKIRPPLPRATELTEGGDMKTFLNTSLLT